MTANHTEALFPPCLFSSLAQQRGELWIPAEWYYWWCTITPLWNELNQFVVRLPLVTHERMISYELETFPIWGPHNSTVQLDLNQLAAWDTMTWSYLSPPCVMDGHLWYLILVSLTNGAAWLQLSLSVTWGDSCSVIMREHPTIFRLLAMNERVLLADWQGVLEE